MNVDVVVPQIGEAIASLTLVTWLKAVGDPVRKGEVLFEVDSDKAIVEVEAFVDGTLAEIRAPAGSSILPQDVVAVIATEQGENAAAHTQTTPAPAAAPPQSDANGDFKATPVAQRVASDLGVDLRQVPGSGRGGRILSDDVRAFSESKAAPQPVITAQQPINASPKARGLAKARQIDLRTVAASHPDGMIRVADVETAARQAATSAPPAPASRTITAPLTKLRQTIAARTLESKQSIPHFYLLVDVDMTEANRLRDYCRAQGWEKPPTYTDLLVRASALALMEHPEANISYSEAGIIQRETTHIGVAVSTDDGLIVPVVRDAAKLDLRATSQAVRGLAKRAREGRLRPDDMAVKSMVISNLGMYQVDAFIAIIDLPDPMILAVGRVADRVVPVNGAALIRPMCTLTLSVDHRALDGVAGARFLEAVKTQLEYPYRLIG